MKVLGISGSPRIGGNTDVLLDKALEGARSKGAETEKINSLCNYSFIPADSNKTISALFLKICLNLSYTRG